MAGLLMFVFPGLALLVNYVNRKFYRCILGLVFTVFGTFLFGYAFVHSIVWKKFILILSCIYQNKSYQQSFIFVFYCLGICRKKHFFLIFSFQEHFPSLLYLSTKNRNNEFAVTVFCKKKFFSYYTIYNQGSAPWRVRDPGHFKITGRD